MADEIIAHVHVFEDKLNVCHALAARIADAANAAVAARGRFSFVLSGGNTPRTLYEVLASDYAQSVPWGAVDFFWGDERYVDADDEDSNYRMAREALLEHVGARAEHIFPMPTEYVNPWDAARAYEAEIREYFDDDDVAFDFVLLGIGDDGHTASIFPDTPASALQGRLVAATEAPFDPQQRLTLSYTVINAAREVHFLASGASKHEPLLDALESTSERALCPAGMVRPTSGQLHWWIDRDAAGDNLRASKM